MNMYNFRLENIFFEEYFLKMGFWLLVSLGIVSLFADITYEGARGVFGPYLAILGASATSLGIVVGICEFLSYGLRLLFGYLTDRTKAYWGFTILGYTLIMSIPFLGFVHSWMAAAFLYILERVGKAIRSPSRDAILSFATKDMGRGLGFGIHEALDQIGAIFGPTAFSFILFLGIGYKRGFAFLSIPALLALATLLFARVKYPSPQELEKSSKDDFKSHKKVPRFGKTFWLYTLFVGTSVLGFVSFPLISYHLKVKELTSDAKIPILYSVAMAADAAVALISGRMYDKLGLSFLGIIPLLTVTIPFFAFSKSFNSTVFAVIILGVVLGVHETVMRAAVADLTHPNQRGSAYGIFNAVYGLFFLVGTSVIGSFYDISKPCLNIFVFFVELLSILIFFLLKRQIFFEDKVPYKF